MAVLIESASDGFPPDEVRDSRAIARRVLALDGCVRVALGSPREDVIDWLKDCQLWEELTPRELAYLSTDRPDAKQVNNISWQAECVIVLLWAIQCVDEMPALDEQVHEALLREILPPHHSVSVEEFIANAVRRDEDVLLDVADDLLDAHWHARNARLNGRPSPPNLDIEIIQERHHAINWVIGYDGAQWDEVTTDT